MGKWWNWVLGITLVSLLFIAIPLTYSSGDKKQQMVSAFEEYIEKFNKSYKNDPAEYDKRFQYFVASMEEIQQLNSLSRGPEEHRARFGPTHLSDMSKDEYTNLHLSDEKYAQHPKTYNRSWSRNYYNVDHDDHHSSEAIVQRAKRAALPLQIDWRTKKVIGPVRNQGLCGACWAFSTIGAMEAQAAIATGKLETLSVQEVIDCAGLGNSGCAGGDICLLLSWLSVTKTAVVKESEYPLSLTDGACRLKKNITGVKLKSFTCDDFVGAEDKILSALATHGPVAVAVNALTWQNYLGGVIQFNCDGKPKSLNHAVELVGYDLTSTVPYYIAKNSWGVEFGNSGYLKLGVGTNMCGLANEVATVDVGIAADPIN